MFSLLEKYPIPKVDFSLTFNLFQNKIQYVVKEGFADHEIPKK